MTNDEIAEAVLDAQAELQIGLGFLRLAMDERYSHAVDLTIIENRLAKSLATSHRLLEALGRPMYQPAQHSEVP